ncbi:MAG: hypothetical protein V1826_01105 [bacterium]
MELEENIAEEEIVDETEPEQELEEPVNRRPRRTRGAGVLLTIFAIVVVVLVGGLASYYYYSRQHQGLESERGLRKVWDDTVSTTEKLTSKLDQVSKFDDLATAGSDNFEKTVNDANRTVRDGIYDLKAQTGLGIAASTFASKLMSFLDDYGVMLGELKRITPKAAEIDDTKELDSLISDRDDMQRSYDELLLVGKGFMTSSSLPRVIFDLPDTIKSLLEAKIKETGTQDEKDKATKQAAERIVTQFVDAWRNRDADGMGRYLTAGAKSAFNPGVLEDASEIKSVPILSTEIKDETKVEIRAQIVKTTPDNQTTTETRRFVLLKTGSDWLIDSWDITT